MSDSIKKGAIKLFVIRLAGKALAFLLFVLLARIMELNSYGELIYLFSWIAIFTVITPAGLDILVLRHINSFISNNKTEYAKGLYFFSSYLSLLIAVISASILVSFLSLTEKVENLTVEMIFSIYSIILLAGYMAIRRNFLLSLKKAVAAELPEAVVRPILVIIMLLAMFYYSEIKLSTSNVILIFATSWGIVTLFSKLWFNHTTKKILTTKAKYRTRSWFQAGFPIMVVSLGFTSMAEIDIIVLANMGTFEDSATYSVATRYMQVFSLPLGVMQSISASSLALYHQRKEANNYTSLASKLSRFSLLIAIPILLVIFFYSEMLLSLFGEDYKKGSLVLIILAFVATANAWFGATGYSLTMTGKQRFLAKLILTALAVNICLDIILIPRMGIEGAAIATLVSVIGWNSIAMLYIKIRLGYLIVWIPFSNYYKVNKL